MQCYSREGERYRKIKPDCRSRSGFTFVEWLNSGDGEILMTCTHLKIGKPLLKKTKQTLFLKPFFWCWNREVDYLTVYSTLSFLICHLLRLHLLRLLNKQSQIVTVVTNLLLINVLGFKVHKH